MPIGVLKYDFAIGTHACVGDSKYPAYSTRYISGRYFMPMNFTINPHIAAYFAELPSTKDSIKAIVTVVIIVVLSVAQLTMLSTLVSCSPISDPSTIDAAAINRTLKSIHLMEKCFTLSTKHKAYKVNMTNEYWGIIADRTMAMNSTSTGIISAICGVPLDSVRYISSSVTDAKIYTIENSIAIKAGTHIYDIN